MKILLLPALITLMFCACRSPYFNYDKDLDLQKEYDEYSINPTAYKLYVKSICVDGMNRPINCRGLEQDTVVEMEYMLMSEDDKRVLVINNLPKRSQKFFEDPSRLMRLHHDIGNINIWFFKQFRFGQIEDDPTLVTGHHLRFTTIEKHPVTYVWQYTVKDDMVTLAAVGERYRDRIDNRISDESLGLVPVFKRVEKFRFVFQVPEQFNKGDAGPIELPDAKWRVLRNSKRDMTTFFLFASPVSGDNKVVYFNGRRMYSYYGEQKR